MGPPDFSLEVSVPLHPTESEDRVRAALYLVFPTMTFDARDAGGPHRLAGSSESPQDLEKLKGLLSQRRILDTTRARLFQSLSGGAAVLLLHKQALCAGKVAIVDTDSESPLGAVRIWIKTATFPDFINHLAPRTVDGSPVDERSLGELGFQDA